MFQPVKKESIVDQIVAAISSEIIDERLQPGDRLTPERELAQRFGTNRNTLREAIKILEGLGLVKVRQGEGITVRPFKNEGTINLLPLYLKSNQPLKEKFRVLEDILFFRRVLLEAAVQIATERIDAQGIQRLRELLNAMDKAQADAPRMMTLDLTFYRTLISHIHSVVFTWLFNSFVSLWEESIDLIAMLWVTPEKYVDTLREIVAMIEGGLHEQAAMQLRSLLKRGDNDVLTLLAGFTSSEDFKHRKG